MKNVSQGIFLWSLIKSFKIFVRTLFVSVTDYRTFFGSAFKELGVSSTSSQSVKNAYADQFKYLKPLPFLGIAIGIAALFHPFQQNMLLDLAQHHPGFSNEFVALLEHLSSTTLAERAKPFGAIVIDFARLFDIPFLDDIVGNFVKYLAYLLFGFIVSYFSRGQADAKAMAYSFTYLVGNMLTVQTAVNIVFTLLYWTVLSDNAGSNMNVMMTLDFLTSTVFGLYILFMPALILSETLGADKQAVMRGVIITFVIWFIATLCLDTILELNGIYIRNYGLSLSSL